MHKWWGNFMTRIAAATKAFQKPDIITVPTDLGADWNEWDSRRVRYDIFWSFYENTAYDEMPGRTWPESYKTKFGMYRYSRNIYNPSYRLGEFWKAHLWAGSLEDIPLLFPEAVDDDDDSNENLLAAIKQIWKWSNWQVKKDIVPLYGSVLGDVGILIVDDPARGKVHFDVVNPANIANVELDAVGNVKAYEIQEERQDPRTLRETTVVYSEIAIRNGDDVIYTTLLDGSPWAWNEAGSSWTRPYGFIPMVLIQHNDVGLQWGWSEIQPGQSKFREIDDQGSKLNDQIRKIEEPIWAFFGVNKPESSPTFTEANLTGTAAANRPQPGREEVNALYGSENGSAVPLVAPLDIDAVINNINTLTKEIERDYPELALMAKLDEAGGNISGRALRLARQPAETKVNQRRPNYYSALVRANQMAIAIAGFNGYDGFGGFGLASFDQGALEHSIGKMPIFAVDQLDELEILKERATIAEMWVRAGASIEQAAVQAGLSEDEAALLASIDLNVLER